MYICVHMYMYIYIHIFVYIYIYHTGLWGLGDRSGDPSVLRGPPSRDSDRRYSQGRSLKGGNQRIKNNNNNSDNNNDQ